MDPLESGHHIVIGPPPLHPLVKLTVATTMVLTPGLVVSLLVGGSPAVVLGLMVPVMVWTALRRFRRIRVTAWEHRLVIDNGRGVLDLDRDAIAAFEIAVPSTAVIVQEGPHYKTWVWERPMVQVIRHDGRRLPLFATLRRRRDPTLERNLTRLEAWLQRPQLGPDSRHP